MAVCPTCRGVGVVHPGSPGGVKPIKAGECEADATTEACPACDGLGLDGEHFEERD